MGNKTEEQPQGYVNGDILKTFYGVTGEDGNFQYNRGHERIPDNWYTRNAADAYSITYLVSDDVEMVLQHLDLDSVGGNTGKVDTFTGVHIADLTGGVLNAATLLEDNNLLCFAMVRTRSDPLSDIPCANTSAVCVTSHLPITRYSGRLFASQSPVLTLHRVLEHLIQQYNQWLIPFIGKSPSSKCPTSSPASFWTSTQPSTKLAPP
jgi:hypothetical protein